MKTGEFDSPSEPKTEAYRDESEYSFDRRRPFGPEQDIRAVNIQIPEYPNGCPILNDSEEN